MSLVPGDGIVVERPRREGATRGRLQVVARDARCVRRAVLADRRQDGVAEAGLEAPGESIAQAAWGGAFVRRGRVPHIAPGILERILDRASGRLIPHAGGETGLCAVV